MKTLFLLFLSSLSFSGVIHAQRHLQLKADTIIVANNLSNAELILQNSTKDVNGFLYNKGNGRTEFRKAVNKVNDSLYLIGNDTLKLNKYKVMNGIKQNADTIKIGGYLTENTMLNGSAVHDVALENLNSYLVEGGRDGTTAYAMMGVDKGKTYLYAKDSSGLAYSGLQTDVVGSASNSTVTRVLVYATNQTNSTYADFAAGKISFNPRSSGTTGYVEFLNIPTGGTSLKTLQLGSNNRLYANTVQTQRWVKGTASGNGTIGTTTPVTIAHGLTGVTSTSSFVITPTSTAAGGYRYATIDATNIYIYYATAPVAGTNNLTYNLSIQ